MVTGKRIERDNKRQRNCERGTNAKNEREQDSERDRHGEAETVEAKGDADNRDSRDGESDNPAATATEAERNVPKEVAVGGVLQLVTGPHVFFGHAAWSTWDLSSPTRDGTRTPCSRSVEA